MVSLRNILRAIKGASVHAYRDIKNHPRTSLATAGILTGAVIGLYFRNHSTDLQSRVRNVSTETRDSKEKNLGANTIVLAGEELVNQSIPEGYSAFINGKEVLHELPFYSIPMRTATETVDETSVLFDGRKYAWVPVKKDLNGNLIVDYRGEGSKIRVKTDWDFNRTVKKGIEKVVIPKFSEKLVRDKKDLYFRIYNQRTEEVPEPLQVLMEGRDYMNPFTPSTLLMNSNSKKEFNYSNQKIHFINSVYIPVVAEIKPTRTLQVGEEERIPKVTGIEVVD